MQFLENKKVIIFDFDGVIIDSMPIRDFGFKEIFKHYDDKDVHLLIDYHQKNGGLSRFHKIKYFYNEILKKEIDNHAILMYADKFSSIMKNELIKKKYLIHQCVQFINLHHQTYSLFIASGSEQMELRYLCHKLKIERFFKGIYGSPVHKNELVKGIIEGNSYEKKDVILIGDSINDYEAASINGIEFAGFNNVKLKTFSKNYINTFFNEC